MKDPSDRSRRRVLQLGLATAATTLLPGASEFVAPPQVYAQGQDPLPSWNNGATKKANRRLFEIAADGTGLHEIRRLRAGEQDFRWTADGKYLVYQSGTDAQSDLWLLPMQTGIFHRTRDPIRLTNGPLPYSRPCPSRDGKQIFAFGTKARGELVHYDLKSKQFVPFLSGISATDPTSSSGTSKAYTR